MGFQVLLQHLQKLFENCYIIHVYNIIVDDFLYLN